MARTDSSRAPQACLVVVVGLLVTAVLALGQLNGSLDSLLDLQLTCSQQQRFSEQLRMDLETVKTRNVRRGEVVKALWRGERTLAQAAAEFRVMDQWRPKEIRSHLREKYPTASEDEFLCYGVIEFASAYLGEIDEAKREEVMEKLTRQLHEETRGGRITFSRTPVAGVFE